MTTIDELRDIVFYIIRKLNDFIINLTREEQPPPRRVIPNQFPNLTIDERIERIRRSINGEEQPPHPPIEESEEIVDEEHEHIMRRIRKIQTSLDTPPPPPPSPSPQEMIKKFIKQDEERIMDLQKQAHEKRIILNYLLDELIQRRERKEDANVIKLLEEEFERLRLERERLEKRIIELKEHIRFMKN